MTESSDQAASGLVLYYAPRTRSLSALWLLEELGEPYQLRSLDLSTNQHKSPEHLAINPMGKVPVVVDRGVPVSEMGAIAIYLADLYRRNALAPAIESPARAAFLRWVFFGTAILEPALAEKFNKWNVDPRRHAWGSFEQMVEVATEGVRAATYLVGDRFSAADVVVASGLRFAMLFGAIPKTGAIADYIDRVSRREAFVRALAIESREGERLPMAR